MSSERVYLHYEPASGGVACTESIPLTKDSTVKYLIQKFIERSATRGVALRQSEARVLDEHGEALDMTDIVLNAVGNKADLFLSISPKIAGHPDTKKTTVSGKSALPSAAVAAPLQPDDLPVEQIVAAAEHLFVEQKFKKLREISSGIMKKRIGGKAEFSIQALACRARLENDNYSDALLSADRMTQLDDASYLAHYLCGRCHIGLGDHEEALLEMQRAISLFGGAAKTTSRVCVDQDKHAIQEIDIRAGEAEALYGLNRHIEAADKLNAVMANPQLKADDHLPTLHVYAKICLAYAKWPDCVRCLLRAIAANHNDKTSKKLLADVLQVPQAFDEMMNQIPKGPQAPAVYAFLGVIARDESAFAVGIRLLSMALAEQPTNASHVLALMHIHENDNDFSSALEVMRRFLCHNSKTRVTYESSESGIRSGFSCGDLASVIEMALNSALGRIASPDVIQWIPEGDHPDVSSGSNNGYADVLSADGSEGTRNFEPQAGGAAADMHFALDILAISFTAVKILYYRGQLAFLPQIIRIVEPTRKDYQKVLATSLHETAIRNEHAYYLCIVQACAVHCERQRKIDLATKDLTTEEPLLVERWLRNRPENLTPPAGAHDVIYICGDSHCMPPAWSTIRSHAHSASGETIFRKFTLVPKLITGLKHWHLRSESRFYPKTTFWKTMSAIPNGSKVIFILGEIDCREGLLRAVEKDAYPNLESAIKHTCSIFVNALKSIVSSKPDLKIFIHPVVPVLDPTRRIVVKYNHALRSAVSAVKGVTWIDIFESMLYNLIEEANHTGVNIVGGGGADVLKLKDSFTFDGTHMHPNYVPLLLEPFMANFL